MIIFGQKGWFLFNRKHFQQEHYELMLILDESIKLHENKVLAKTFIRGYSKT